MKNNVIKFKNDIKLYVLDELDYKGKKYIFGLELDEKGMPIEENVHTLEVAVNDNNLVTNEITDFEIASVVNNIFLARLANGEE